MSKQISLDEEPKTFSIYRYMDLYPNPLNPRRLFDKYKLDTLEESIRSNKILVPLTVYRDSKTKKIYILDGERRWRCAQRIETGEVSIEMESMPSDIEIPKNLKDILIFDSDAKVLFHREPITEVRYKELLTLSGLNTWKKNIVELYELSQQRPKKKVDVPVNIVDPPSKTANLLYMFHVHNLREQWELMPTALSLKVLIGELGTDDEVKLAELTNLSVQHVKRCKILLGYKQEYQNLMMEPDPQKRIKANFFTEMYPVLELYREFGSRISQNKNQDEIIDLFIEKYRNHKISSVTHFRKILEAYDLLKDEDRLDEVKRAATELIKDPERSIKSLFDPLVAEERQVKDVSELCQTFLRDIRKLKLAHTTKKKNLIKALESVRDEVTNLLESIA